MSSRVEPGSESDSASTYVLLTMSVTTGKDFERPTEGVSGHVQRL